MMGATRPSRALAALLSGLLLVGVACGGGGSQASGSYPTINEIPCDLGERLAFHIHAHVAIYAGGQPLTVPYGIGIGKPWQVQQSTEGPLSLRVRAFTGCTRTPVTGSFTSSRLCSERLRLATSSRSGVSR